jgi:hypothetical protein
MLVPPVQSMIGATPRSATRSEMRMMMMSNSTSRPALEVNRSWMTSGVVMLCVGFFVWLIGAALSATALAQAAMKWISQLEESPSEIARRRAHQFKEAVSAGSKAWQEQTHR